MIWLFIIIKIAETQAVAWPASVVSVVSILLLISSNRVEYLVI